MTKHDYVVRDLLDALDRIHREAQKVDARLAYISGIASQAAKNALAECECNADGYMVVKS